MSLIDLTALLVGLTALLSVLNTRVWRLPASIGVTVGGLLLSLLLTLLAALHVPLAVHLVDVVRGVQFGDFLFQGVLSFLLFAGALSLNSQGLWALRGPVAAFALLSTALSTALLGGLTWGLMHLFGLNVPLSFALLFGALISPTDPVAVLGMLKQARVPSQIETLVAGESLFNDGVGVVAFAVLLGVAAAGEHGPALSAAGLTLYFLQEAVGGLLLGSVLGALAYWLLRSVKDFVTEVLLTVSLVLCITSVAAHLHVSGPLAAVAAGLLVGSLTDRRPASLSSRERFDSVWHLTDELLNVALFALLALKIVAVPFSGRALLLGALSVPLVLLVRTFSVLVPVQLLRSRASFPPYTRRLMVWGGLRGAISVALAFMVPPGEARDLFLVMTYTVVVFSIVVQGLTVGRLALRAAAAQARTHAAEPSGPQSSR